MKKFTFMLLAAFIAVAAMAAGPEKRGMQALKANAVLTSSAKQVTPMAKAVKVQAPVADKFNKVAQKAKAGAKKAQKKVGLEDLLAQNWMICSEYYEYDSEAGSLVAATPAAGGHAASFTMVDEQTIAISNFTSDATEAIQGTFTLTTDEKLLEAGVIAELSIPDGQTLQVNETYGTVILRNVSAEEGTPIAAYVFADGYVLFDAVWMDILADGDYAGYMWSGYYYSTFAQPANGTMTWAKSGADNEVFVLIEQDPESPKYATVYNFGGEETAVVVTMKPDNKFAIESQFMFDAGTTYGQFYTYATDGSSVSSTITGTGTESALTFDGGWTFYAPSTGYWYGLLDAATIAYTDGTQFVYPVIVEVPAVPANPEFAGVGNYDSSNGYGYVLVDVPAVDVEGNDLLEDKLYYQFFSDIAGEIQPITFTTDLYVKLTEDMSVIPYTFTDGYDFDSHNGYKVVYLNYDFNTMYDRIGVKSIYTGGGETNESEIAWVEIEKPEPVVVEATFDFNAMEVATSSNVTHDGDITETVELTEGNVTLAISPKEEGKTTENRFWGTSAGPQLRVYSGTLTFSVPAGYAITQIVFNTAKWSDDNAADSGEFEGTTWTGNAQTVVVTIAANTQINSIVVTSEPAVESLLELPEGLETEVWTIEGIFEDSESANEIQRRTEVAFDGTDVYVKGIPFYFEDSWMKGTLDTESNIVTFATGQFVGEDSYGKEYMVGFNAETEEICDIEFAFDAEAQTLTQITDYILENADTRDEWSPWGYWYDMVIYAGEPIVIDPVVAPEDLATDTYLFKAQEYVTENEYDDEGNVINTNSYWQDYSFQTQVGFDGNDVYFKGFSENTVDLWAKGTLSEDGKTVTIPACQYMGELAILWSTFKYNITALDEEGNMVDLVLNYDAETNTFSTNQIMALNEGSKTFNPYQIFANVTITKMEEFAATPANPWIEGIKIEGTNYPKANFNIPAEDVEGNALLTSKLFYTVWIEKDGVQSVYTVSANEYKNVTEDMVEIPYDYDDSYDIYRGGETFYFNPTDEPVTRSKIGIQSIYYGAGECHKSDVIWTETSTGIESIQENGKDEVIYNLAGQRVQKTQKGIFIVNGKKVLR